MVKSMKGRERIGSSLADQLGPSALVVYTSSFTVSQSIWCDHSDKSPSLEFSNTAVCFYYYYFTILKKIKDFDFESIVLTGTINLANKDFRGLLTVLNSELSHTVVVSLCVFSLVQTFCLTVRAYLNTQKYGLFCSLRPCVIHNLFNKSTIIFYGLYSFRTERMSKCSAVKWNHELQASVFRAKFETF